MFKQIYAQLNNFYIAKQMFIARAMYNYRIKTSQAQFDYARFIVNKNNNKISDGSINTTY